MIPDVEITMLVGGVKHDLTIDGELLALARDPAEFIAGEVQSVLRTALKD